MKARKPPEEVVLECFPAWEVPGVSLRDIGLTQINAAEVQNGLRLPRQGEFQASLVAVRRFYDGTGTGSGEPGHYLAMWHELRLRGQRWKTPTLKVRAEEAARVAKALVARKASVPGPQEPARAAGRKGDNDQSRLRGVPVGKDGYLLFVESTPKNSDEPFRSRGVEILTPEAGIVAGLLKQLALEVK